MALEFLNTGVFNLKSDIWSYGVVVWEMFSLGKPEDLLLIQKIVRRMNGSKYKIDNGPIVEKAENLWP